MKTKTKKLKLLPNSNKRNDQIAAGVYDGRYKQKVVPNKKKKAAKLWARKINKNNLYE